MEKNNKKIIKYYIIIASILILGVFFDILTKCLFTSKNYSLIENVISVFYTENTGAGWSLMSDNTILLTIITGVILLALVIFNFIFKPKGKLYSISMGLIVAGAFGNFIDRLFLGYVRDFIKLDFINFPIFNLADICLTVGAVLICIWILFFSTKTEVKIDDK